MSAHTEFEVTLTADLHQSLLREARRLGVPLRYLVASVVLDTLEGVEVQVCEESAVSAMLG